MRGGGGGLDHVRATWGLGTRPRVPDNVLIQLREAVSRPPIVGDVHGVEPEGVAAVQLAGYRIETAAQTFPRRAVRVQHLAKICWMTGQAISST